MNIKQSIQVAAVLALCGTFTYGTANDTWASYDTLSGPGLGSGEYVATVDVDTVNINVSHDSNEVLLKATKGQSFTVLEDMGDGWLKVKAKDTVGYIPLTGNASVSELAEIEASDSEQVVEAEAPEEPAADVNARRQNLVNYAMQFVGGKYRYGGNDPRTGVDCSGFTRFVMQHGAGVGLNRSSGAQSTQGVPVSAEQMRPGDLLFYGNGRNINHVAMYIGNGQIVHASTYKTGIKVSNWNYRAPVKIVNVLGD